MFALPQETIEPVYAWHRCSLSRNVKRNPAKPAGQVILFYARFPSQAAVTDGTPPEPDTGLQVTVEGQTAQWLLDSSEDALYTRLRDLVLRGLSDQLTEQEADDVDGLPELGAALSGATHLG